MRSPTSLRVEYDLELVSQFLKDNGYPFEWSSDQLGTTLVIRAFDDGDNTVAYFWGQWVQTGVMAFHVCVAKGRYGICFRRPVIAELEKIAFLVGADELLTSVGGLPHAARLRLILLHQGFEEVDEAYGKQQIFTKNLWT